MGVCDISADYDGSIEFTRKFTSIEEPFICFDIMKDDFTDKINEANDDCILFHSVDHLPAEMPKEASNHFGQALYPFVADVVKSTNTTPFKEQQDELPIEIYNAIVCCQGVLTPQYKYISELREMYEKAKAKQDELKFKNRGIKRVNSLVNINMKGHLFDTKGFN